MSTQVKPDPTRTVLVQKQRANVYTVMLILSFAAIVTACIFLRMLMSEFYKGDYKVPQADKVPARPATAFFVPSATDFKPVCSNRIHAVPGAGEACHDRMNAVTTNGLA